MSRVRISAMGLLSAAFVSGIAEAHHSITANFDQSREIEIRGEVVDFNYVSPHASMVIDGIAFEDGEALNGSTQRWEIESSAVKGLAGRGITADTFQSGDRIMVRGAPHRNADLYRANSSNFLAIDGSALDYSAPLSSDIVVPQVEGARRVEGRWRPPFQRPGERSVLPLNDAGNQAWRDYDQTQSPANTCEPMSVPVVMNAPSYYLDIRFSDGQVVIYNEAYDVDRTALLGNDFAAANPNGQWGDVRGRIEGDALVVDSQNYAPSAWGLGAATQINGGGADVPSSAQKMMTERFSTSEDGLELYYDYVLNDPMYLTGEHAARVVLSRVADDALMVKYDCNVASAKQFSRAPGETVLTDDE